VPVSPHTRLIPLGLLVLLAACGEPPQPLPTSPPFVTPSGAPISLSPSLPLVTQPLPTLTALPPGQTVPTYTYAYPTVAATPTLPPDTVSPTPTPSHAPRCSGAPTRSQIITLINGKPGIPSDPLEVSDGPYCSGEWSFATVQLVGENADQDEPLMVAATGKGSTLALVAAGSDVCTDRVQNDAPAGIRVLACGF
jgi:hypothetical protein